MKFKFVALLSTCLMAICVPSYGHHSFSPHYDAEKIITITGELAEFQFRNPHSYLFLKVANESGAVDLWTCEMSGAVSLRRKGISSEQFRPGETLTVSGPAARRDPTGCFTYDVTSADGSRIQLRGGEAVADAPAEANDSMFGNWLIVPRSGVLRADRVFNDHSGPNVFEAQLTAAGRAAHAEYDPLIDDPSFTCTPASPWRTWDAPGTPTRIERSDDRILIRHEWMDAVREIHLDQDSHPADLSPSPLGHSIGRLQGNTLTVDTVGFSTGVLLPHPGVLMSPDARLLERVVFNEGTGQLMVSWRLDDPSYYTSPPVGEFTFEATGLQLQRFDCVPDL